MRQRVVTAAWSILTRRYQNRRSQAIMEADAAPPHELHRDVAFASHPQTITYSMLTSEVGVHIGDQLRRGHIQTAEALWCLWRSVISSLDSDVDREDAIQFHKAIEEAQKRVERHTAIVERTIAAHGYRFGETRNRETNLPHMLLRHAADELVRECRADLFFGDRTDDLELARHAWHTGQSLKLVDQVIWTKRIQNRYVELQKGEPQPASVAGPCEQAAELVEPMRTSECLGYEAITAEAERQIRRQLSFLLLHTSHTPEVWNRIKAQCFFQAEGVLHLWESLSKGIVLNEDLTRLQRIVFFDIKDASGPMQPTDAHAAGDHRGGA